MSNVYTYELKLTFRGPLMSQASGTLSFGVDSAMLRDEHNQPVLNGSLVRGNIREAMLLFADELALTGNKKISREMIYSWFGKESSNDPDECKENQVGGFAAGTSQVAFDFFWTLTEQSTYTDDQYRTRISIDADTGKVKPAALQVIEDCFPLGSSPVFSGCIHARLSSEQEAAKFQRLLEMALEYIPAMGSFKGIGFGKLEKAEVLAGSAISAPEHNVDDQLTGDEVNIGFAFTPDRAFCLGKPRRPDSNRIVSDDIIGGNVIKALLAHAISGTDQLLQDLQFDRWQVSHFVPVAKDQPGRPMCVIPLSIAMTGNDKHEEVVFQDLHQLSAQEVAQKQWETAPKFRPDWKNEADYWQLVGNGKPSTPKRRLQVRTAINSETQTAKESQLFSMECIVPDGFVWRGNISLQGVDEAQQGAALQALRAASGQLTGLGKTKAKLAEVQLLPQVFSKPGHNDVQVNVVSGAYVTITLLTPARLFLLGWERKNKAQTAQDLYQSYWKDASGNSLGLENFFAQQQMQGGAYHYHHFQNNSKANPPPDYAPEWMTQPGSVFVLTVIDADKAQKYLEDWLQNGLPVPEGKHISWKDSPYLPEHGFGEIALNWLPVGQ